MQDDDTTQQAGDVQPGDTAPSAPPTPPTADLPPAETVDGVGYKVQKQMMFGGVQFEPGDVFVPQLNNCPPHRLKQLRKSMYVSDEVVQGPAKAAAPKRGRLRLSRK